MPCCRARGRSAPVYDTSAEAIGERRGTRSKRPNRATRRRQVARRPLADRDRMFAPFERLGTTRDTDRVGLGLTLARGLTEAMHGTLEPEMTPGGGLTMTISLPAAATP